jgi:hypothetical protein
MPQLDFGTVWSQLFWINCCFLILFFLVGKYLVPLSMFHRFTNFRYLELSCPRYEEDAPWYLRIHFLIFSQIYALWEGDSQFLRCRPSLVSFGEDFIWGRFYGFGAWCTAMQEGQAFSVYENLLNTVHAPRLALV